MKVFISWSGDLSQQIAAELFEWLPMVLQSVQPYMSSESIDKGTRWASSIASELEGTSVGIIVLTPENRLAPWINFEAGALAKVVGDARLAPVLFGLKPSEVGTPLSQFQVTQFQKSDALRLLKSINACSAEEALPDARLERMHDALWDQIEGKIQPILSDLTKRSAPNVSSRASTEGVSKALEEILTLARQQAQFVMNPERMLTPDVIRQISDHANRSGLDARSTDMVQSYSSRAYALWEILSPSLSTPSGSEDDASKLELRERFMEFDRLLRRIVDTAHGRRRFSFSRSSSPNVRGVNTDRVVVLRNDSGKED